MSLLGIPLGIQYSALDLIDCDIDIGTKFCP